MTDLELANVRDSAQALAQAITRHAAAIEQGAAVLLRDVVLREAVEARIASKTRPDDGKEDEAIAFVKNHPDMSVVNTVAALTAKGMTRTRQWVLEQRFALGLPVGRRSG